MNWDDLGPILIAIITALTSTTAWRFYDKRLSASDKKQEDTQEQINMFRDNLRERVAVLESKLEQSHSERNELQQRILKLAEATAAMRVEIDFLRRENETLRKQLKAAGGPASPDGKP